MQEHHIFPRAQLQGLPSDLIDNLGNIAFIRATPNRKISDKLPSSYLPKIVAEYGEARLSAQCVPTEPEYWERDFYEDFLLERRRLIAKAVNERLARLGAHISKDVSLTDRSLVASEVKGAADAK